MISVKLTLEDLGASALLRSILSPAFIRGANEVAGRAGANAVQAHLRDQDKTPNALGGRRTHFYSLAAMAVQHTVDDDGALISVAHLGLAQRYFGGVITPVNTDYLAIPATAAAHGRRPRDSDNPELAPFYRRKNGKAKVIGLADQVRYSKRGRAYGTGEVWYWLVKSVTQQPDPDVLPTETALREASLTAVESYTNRHLDRARSRIHEEMHT